MFQKPQEEHQWVQRLVGEWDFEHEAVGGPDQPPTKSTGSETVRSLGGFWVLAEGEGEMPGGGEARSVMTLGYDPQQQRYVGTWVGSMMSQMWIYSGTLDESGQVLVLDTEGPSFEGEGKRAKYQDIIEFKSDDHRTLTSRVQGEDGEWRQFMHGNYRRRK